MAGGRGAPIHFEILDAAFVACRSMVTLRQRTDDIDFAVQWLMHRGNQMAMLTDRIAHGFLASRLRSSQASFRAGTAVGNLVARLLDWQERARQRRQLLALDGAALKDFGRNLADATHEGATPFWRT
jgi:uncharacterized protein YjiS (DUF1127 family)